MLFWSRGLACQFISLYCTVQGYDMEDAIIINKSSYERGFCHGQIYKTEVFNVFFRSFYVVMSLRQEEYILDKMILDSLIA